MHFTKRLNGFPFCHRSIATQDRSVDLPEQLRAVISKPAPMGCHKTVSSASGKRRERSCQNWSFNKDGLRPKQNTRISRKTD